MAASVIANPLCVDGSDTSTTFTVEVSTNSGLAPLFAVTYSIYWSLTPLNATNPPDWTIATVNALPPNGGPFGVTATATGLPLGVPIYWFVRVINANDPPGSNEATLGPIQCLRDVTPAPLAPVTQFACGLWATPQDVVNCDCACDLTLPDDLVLLTNLLGAAADILYVLSGGRVTGRCDRTVRPCKETSCGCGASSSDACRCCRVSSIPLLDLGDIDVTSVIIDGAPLPAAEWRMSYIGGLPHLVRQASSDDMPTWAGCQQLWRPLGDPHTWSITYTSGIRGDAQAAIELACELAKGCRRAPSCLPGTADRLSWQGTSINIQDAADEARAAGQSLPAVARFVAIYNPKNRPMPMSWTPDLNDGWTFVQDF